MPIVNSEEIDTALKVDQKTTIKKFGEQALALTKELERAKFELKSKYCLLRPFIASKVYHIWIPDIKKVIMSPDVKFLGNFESPVGGRTIFRRDIGQRTLKKNLKLATSS